jgi:transcriptional regulator GlxA family with amidase domain
MSSSGLTIGVVLIGPFMLTDASGPIDLFAMAARRLGLAPGEAVDSSKEALTVHWIGANTDPFHAGIGVTLTPTCTFDAAPKLDILFIPGPLPDYVAPPNVAAYIRRAAVETPIVMSVCSGSLVLAQLGILDGKPASTNAEMTDFARKAYPKVQWQDGVRWTVDGKLWTSGGVIEGISMMANFIRSGRYGDAERAVKEASLLMAFKPQSQYF